MKSKRFAWSLLVAGVVFGAAACGSSGGGGDDARGGNDSGGSGGGEPGGSGGGDSLIDNEACHACGESACAGAFDDCQSAGSCMELVDCLFGCLEGDETCVQDCAAGYDPNDAGDQEAAGAAATYWGCALAQCAEECVALPDGGAGGDGVPLQPTNGAISGDNPAGIQGSFFVTADDGGSTISLSAVGSSLCVSGSVAKVPDCPTGDCLVDYWGALLGLSLAEAEAGAPRPYDAAAAGVKGFAFTITGPMIPPAIRFSAQEVGSPENHCTDVGSGDSSVPFSSLARECWSPQASLWSLDESRLDDLRWFITTDSNASHPFDFCIENLRALR